MVTPAGFYSPDFAILLQLNEKKILLEVKDDDRFGRENQDATIKAKAANVWCKATTEATGTIWEYRIIMDSDAQDCQTFEDIMDNSESVDED